MPGARVDLLQQIMARLRAVLPSDIPVRELVSDDELTAMLDQTPAVFVSLRSCAGDGTPTRLVNPERQNQRWAWEVLVAGKRVEVAPAGRSALDVLELVFDALRGWSPSGHPGAVLHFEEESLAQLIYQGAVYRQVWTHWRQQVA